MAVAQKTPLARGLSRFAQRKAIEEISKLGYAPPGHVVAVNGAIVTINFDVSGLTLPQVQMPLFGPEYIRYPVQVGDKGVAFPASFYLGGVSGLGDGTADDTQRGNLATLVWFPIGNAKWAAPPGADANTLALYGKLTTLLLDSIAGHSSVKLTAGGITLTYGNGSLVMNATGITLTFGAHTIVINATGVTIDGRVFLAHEHTPGAMVVGSSPVTNNSGGVV